MLNTLVSRIESNCYNNFAIPVIPPPRRTQSVFSDWELTIHAAPLSFKSSRGPRPSSSGTARSSSVPQDDVDKENTKPASGGASAEEIEDVSLSSVGQEASAGKDSGKNGGKAADDAPAAAAAASTSTSNDASKPSASASASTAMPPPPTPAPKDAAGATSAPATTEAPTMPEPAVELLAYITKHLKTTFPKYPPHSIQRLSELVVYPHQHYRYLGPYLYALERVVSVTSGNNLYPLPSELPPSQAALLNGAEDAEAGEAGKTGKAGSAAGASAESAQDWSGDSSWGALLTPIPWLRGQQPNNNSNTDDDRSTTEEAGGDGGSSPLDGSDDDGSEIAFSTTSSTAGGASRSNTNARTRDDGGNRARDAHSSSRSPSPSRGLTSLQQQQQQQQQQFQQTPQTKSSLPSQPQQRRLEVRTEATETIDGPNGIGSIETVSVSINGIASHGAAAAAAVVHLQQRGITQGELLRQEQKAGVVPVSQLARAAAAARAAAGGRYSSRYMDHDDDDDEPEEDEDHEMEDSAPSRIPFAVEASPAADTAMGGTAGDKDEAESSDEAKAKAEAADAADTADEDEIPHARGPQALGAADMGPQPQSSSTSAPGLQIGSAADASAVHIGEMNLESAVGRPADELPAGTVAAPLVPSVSSVSSASASASASSVVSVVNSTEAADKDDAAPTGTAPSSVLSPARATTPKREAGQSPNAALPAKKRKGDSSKDNKGGKAADGDKAAEPGAVPEAGKDDAGREKQ